MTTKQTRQALYDNIVLWMQEADAPAAANIRKYNTAPDDTADDPNWIILASMGPGFTEDGMSGYALDPHIAVTFMSRIQEGDDASDEAAENWLDDVEDFILKKILDTESDDWGKATMLVDMPRRDKLPAWHGLYRTSQTPFKFRN